VRFTNRRFFSDGVCKATKNGLRLSGSFSLFKEKLISVDAMCFLVQTVFEGIFQLPDAHPRTVIE